MTANGTPNVPIPYGAKSAGGWGDDGAGGMQSRSVVWTEHHGGGVAVDGRQWPDGTTDAAVSIYLGDGTQLDAAQARKLAAALLDAADELDEIGSP
jgi:hypothetical protein